MRKPLHSIYHWLQRLPLRIRLFLLISVILLFAVCFLSLRMMEIYQRDMVQSAGEQTLSSLRQTAERINQKLVTINDALDQMTMDSNLTDFFVQKQNGKALEARDIFLNTRSLGNIIGRYLRQEDIDTYLFYTTPYVLGGLISTQSPAVSPAGFLASSICQTAMSANYATVWFPVYDLGSAFHLPAFQNTSRLQNLRYVFSAVRQLNFMYYENNSLQVLPASAERPVILVNFQAGILKEWIGDNIGYDHLRYRLLSSDRTPFYDSAPEDPDFPALYLTAEEGAAIYGEGSASRMAFISPIACPGWYLTCDTSLIEIVGNATYRAFNLLFGWIAMLLMVSLVMAYLVTRGVTKPIAAMTGAVHKVAAGDFSVRMQVPKEKEFWELTNAFNQMGSEIQRLIHENYAITLKETQSQLAALNLQLNPHFLYNSLNVMNLIALENDQKELAHLIAALSRMLQYALKQSNGLVSLREELDWLKSFLAVMEGRFEGMFHVEYDISEAALHCDVPKLILQPIVENCFVHGYIGSIPHGLIKLSAHLDGKNLRLAVEDNGRGMDVEKVLREMREPPTDCHIGLSNAYQRMKLIYGEGADIHLDLNALSGSCVTLVIPQKASA